MADSRPVREGASTISLLLYWNQAAGRHSFVDKCLRTFEECEADLGMPKFAEKF